jgi:hypothetical protein
MVTDTGAVVSFETNYPTRSYISVDNRQFGETDPATHHEIALSGLSPNREYSYTISYGSYQDSYAFRTAPEAGSRLPFTFAYASDGRGNNGGGERYIYGTNAYVIKRIGLMGIDKNARFLQYTGDMIDGYTHDPDEIRLHYANWKRAIDPFAHTLPIIPGLGNHEGLFHTFVQGMKKVFIDKFPYETLSTEALFAENFVLPQNGPGSEDGAIYDPDPETTDFPSYKENVYYYAYDNVAMVVLNSTYWFSRSLSRTPEIGGNLKGYLMDNQVAWLKSTLQTLESDENIDHIFVTVHTPIFPNGGHVRDDMWWGGDNSFRATIAGKPVEKGIIERRDELLDLMMNHSTKVIAALTGDEHNYNRLLLTEDMPIYPDDYPHERLTSFRPIWMINNGAGGAPYYGKEETPWQEHLKVFTTQNALVFFHVDGKKVDCEVINPDTGEMLDKFEL